MVTKKEVQLRPPEKEKITFDRSPREIIADGVGRICSEFDDRLAPADRKLIEETDLEGMGFYHHGFGTFIRNRYGLWSGETPIGKAFHDLGITHADYASGVILNEYWRHVHQEASQLDQEISDALASLGADRKAYEEAAAKAAKEAEEAGPVDPFAPPKQ